MLAMNLSGPGQLLVGAEPLLPEPGEREVRVKVLACGVVVRAGIHMSDIPSFEHALLWGERSIRSVANLTREDGEAFFALIEHYPVTTHVQTFALAQASEVIAALGAGGVDGAAVLVP